MKQMYSKEELENIIKATPISSGEATEGQALTADGNGGTEWKNINVKVYEHNIQFTYNATSSWHIYVNVTLITNSSTAITKDTFTTYLANTRNLATGFGKLDTTSYGIMDVEKQSSTSFIVKGFNLTGSSTSPANVVSVTTTSSSFVLSDNVREI